MGASAGVLAAVFGALYAAHHVADHWVQTQHQAETKGCPGWAGRWACLKHVVTYTVTSLLAVLAVVWRTGAEVSPVALTLGLAVSAVTHYIADRRIPLRRIADSLGEGKGKFYRLADFGLNGAYLLDQSWHVGWLFIAALVIGGTA